MKKTRGMLVALLAAMLVASLGVLAACGGQSGQSSKAKDSFSISGEPEQQVELKTSPFYVLVIGQDTREGTVNLKGQYADGKGRADTAMFVRVDPTKHTFDLITIPRDSQATYDGDKVKINETFERGGIEGYKKAVKELTGVDADYYLVTSFVGFEDIIDAMGGITANVPLDESMEDVVSGEMVEFPAGEQKLDGKQALAFARERHAYEPYYGGDLQESRRQVNDRYIMETIINTILALGPDKASDLAKTLYKYVDTDLTEAELAAYVKDFAENADKVKFTSSCSGPYWGDIDEETGKWLAFRDEDTWRELIKAVESGKDPNEIVEIPVIDIGAAASTDQGSGEPSGADGEAGDEAGDEA